MPTMGPARRAHRLEAEGRAGETGGGDPPPDRINVDSWGTGGQEKIQKWALLTDIQLFSVVF